MKKFIPVVLLTMLQVALLAQAQRTVLFEEFSGENCGPCAAINPSVRDFVDNHPGMVILLKYQANIPSAGILYNQNKADVNNRKTYYGVTSAPWGQQDGKNFYTGSNHPYYWVNDETILTNRYAITSPFNLSVNHTLSSGGDSFYVSVNLNAAQAYTVSSTGKLKLRVAMVEDMDFAHAPGNNGETSFHHAMRKMYPTPVGTSLVDNWNSGDSKTVNFAGVLPSYIYDKTKIVFIAWIQDDGTKEVQQSAISTEELLINDVSSLGIQSHFYNCGASIAPVLLLNNAGSAILTNAVADVYLDGSFNTNYNWTGSIASGTVASVSLPAITASEGTHQLMVVVSQPNGVDDANIGKDTSFIDFTIAAPAVSAPVTESFEAGLPAGWAIENPDDDAALWHQVSTGSGSGKSFELDFYNSPDANLDYLYLPKVNLVGYDEAFIKFDRANAEYTDGTNHSYDTLNIQLSKNCGLTWQTVYSKAGDALATAPASGSSYVPTSGQWKSDSADISYGANSADVLIRFKGASNFGNNLYLDNINVYQAGNVVSGINDAIAFGHVVLFPNPAKEQLRISFTSDKQASLVYEVINTVGQKMITGETQIGNGQTQLTLDTRNLTNGVYILNMISGGNRVVKKFTVAQ
jgi:hypothetical protein